MLISKVDQVILDLSFNKNMENIFPILNDIQYTLNNYL